VAPAAANAVNRAEEDGVEEVKVVRAPGDALPNACKTPCAEFPTSPMSEEADVTELEALRRELNASSGNPRPPNAASVF